MNEKIEMIIRILESHADYRSHSHGSLRYLEGVAGIRFALMEISRILYSLFSTKDISPSYEVQQSVSRLMQHAEEVCANVTGTPDISGPALYLLKMIVRPFGFPCLKFVSEIFEWVIPESLRVSTKVCCFFLLFCSWALSDYV